MMCGKLYRNILSVPKLLRAATLSCSHCIESQVSGSLILCVHPNENMSLNRDLIYNFNAYFHMYIHILEVLRRSKMYLFIYLFVLS